LELEAVLSKLGQVQAILDDVPRQAALASRAVRLAGALRRLWPDSSAYFALLVEGAERHTVALDRVGRPLPWLADMVAAALSGAGRGAGCLPLPSSSGAGKVLVSHEIVAGGSHWGHLGLALDAGDALFRTMLAQRLLSQLARTLAVRLCFTAQERLLERLRERLARQTVLADVAETAGPLTHEFNNFLNVLLLQISALAPALPEDVQAEMEQLRRQGRATAALIRSWQRYRQQGQPPGRPIDLAEVIREALEELQLTQGLASPGLATEASLTFVTRLSSGLPAVEACPHDLRRLLTFLLRNAVAALGVDEGVIEVETEASDGRVLLRVRDSGPAVSVEVLQALFEPHGAAREGTIALELAACASIARRYLGKLRGANSPGGGVAVELELPVSTPSA